MPHVELYIADKLCDLQGDEKIEVDYSIFDITKIDSRGGARSYTFNLPKTNLNKSVLENPEMVNNASLIPYTRLKCRCYIDGVDSLIRFCEVSSVKDSYEVRLYGSNSDLFAELKDKKLSELDMRELDHYWNIQNIAAGVARTVNDGYVYPIIDYHLDSPNSFINNYSKQIATEYIYPSLYYNFLLDKIFAATEYQLINEVATETDNVIICWSGKRLVRNFDERKYEAKFSIDLLLIDGITPGFNIVSIPPAVDLRSIYFNVFDFSGGQFYTVGANDLDTKIYFGDSIKCKIKFTFIIENLEFFNTDMYFEYRYSAGIPTEAVGNFIITTTPGTFTYEQTIEVEISKRYDMVEDEVPYIFFRAYVSTALSSLTILNGTTLEIFDVEIIEPYLIKYNTSLTPLRYLTLTSILPDITQLELLKNYMQMFCLLPVINEFNKTVTLVKFNTLLDNISNCYDWSSKLDLTEEVEITFIDSNYAQSNKFIYTQDGDEPKPIGTDGTIVINNQNLEKEKTIIELIFAGTNSVERLEGLQVDNIGIFENGEYKSEREPRVLVANIETYPYSITLADNGATSYAVVTFARPYFIDDSQTFNLGFGNNLLDTYYNLLEEVLSRVKLVKLLVRINASDISQLDFTRPVFIQKYESYFYINSIKAFSYTESKSTLVELVKINING